MSNVMSNKNPYRDGSLYNKIFAYWEQKQVVTRKELMDYTMNELGKSEASASAAINAILSPRKESKRGDCRGNIAAHGHIYYADKLPRNVQDGVKEVQKFGLAWRDPILESRIRELSETVEPVKTETVQPVDTVTPPEVDTVTPPEVNDETPMV